MKAAGDRKTLFSLGLILTCLITTQPGQALDVQLEEAPVIGTIQALAKSAGLDLVLSGDQAIPQNRKVTVRLNNVTPEAALDYILRANGFGYEKRGQVILVSALPQDILATGYQPEMVVFRLKYLAANRAVDILTKVMPGAVFQVGERANSVILRGRQTEVVQAKELLAEIDRAAPQILIESRVLELTQNDALKLGISYGNGVYKLVTDKTTKKTTPAENLVTTINALVTDGRAKVVAAPRIATLDNQEALINIGSRIPYAVPVTSGGATTQWTVDYIDAGVKLKITPQLGQENYITTLIQPEVSSVSEWRTTAAGDFPVISTRNAAAIVRIKNGETIIVGGLISESERENITRVPLLGYIPILGLLFQNKSLEKEKSEIVFLITPRVI